MNQDDKNINERIISGFQIIWTIWMDRLLNQTSYWRNVSEYM